jgi:hypothetical protein
MHGTCVERDKPIMRLSQQEGISQDLLMAWSAKDEGESESRPVMGRIGIASEEKIIPRESGQTSLWSFRARALEYRLRR